MKIEILGCNGGVGPGLRSTCLRIVSCLLVDTGTGACELSPQEMAALTDVFLTHAHLDHTVGLAFIADNRIGRAPRPLAVHAQAETLQVLHEHLFNWQVWPDFTALPDSDNPTLRFIPLPAAPARCQGLEFIPFPSQHTIPTTGYAIRHSGGVFAFTGDTYGHPAMWQSLNALERLDQLMIEVSYGDELADVGTVARHLTPARLAQQLKALHHRPQLLLSHHKTGQETAVRQQCQAALGNWRYRHLHNGECFEV
ncbi:MAG: 3',5'-cyclic-nucleotide phosphodiesterase [Sinobacteraceae bacterium]|nr:3',5'-cyclic-nucleotide phosphodiesterase [Nevskiaceae bacterium]